MKDIRDPSSSVKDVIIDIESQQPYKIIHNVDSDMDSLKDIFYFPPAPIRRAPEPPTTRPFPPMNSRGRGRGSDPRRPLVLRHLRRPVRPRCQSRVVNNRLPVFKNLTNPARANSREVFVPTDSVIKRIPSPVPRSNPLPSILEEVSIPRSVSEPFKLYDEGLKGKLDAESIEKACNKIRDDMFLMTKKLREELDELPPLVPASLPTPPIPATPDNSGSDIDDECSYSYSYSLSDSKESYSYTDEESVYYDEESDEESYKDEESESDSLPGLVSMDNSEGSYVSEIFIDRSSSPTESSSSCSEKRSCETEIDLLINELKVQSSRSHEDQVDEIKELNEVVFVKDFDESPVEVLENDDMCTWEKDFPEVPPIFPGFDDSSKLQKGESDIDAFFSNLAGNSHNRRDQDKSEEKKDFRDVLDKAISKMKKPLSDEEKKIKGSPLLRIRDDNFLGNDRCAPVRAIGDSLLNNQYDQNKAPAVAELGLVGVIEPENTEKQSCIDVVEDDFNKAIPIPVPSKQEVTDTSHTKCLVMRMSTISGTTLTKMKDNFDEMSSDSCPPKKLMAELKTIKERVLSNKTDIIDVSTITFGDNGILYKILRVYYKIYPNKEETPYRPHWFGMNASGMPTNVFDATSVNGPWNNSSINKNKPFGPNQFEKGRLLAVLDKMISKYREMSEDRGILDNCEDLADEILDVTTEYNELQKQIDYYERYQNSLKNLKMNLMQLSNLGMEDSVLKENQVSIDTSIVDKIESFVDLISETKLKGLVEECNRCQAKFNYYQKISNRITSLLTFPGLNDNDKKADSGIYSEIPMFKRDHTIDSEIPMFKRDHFPIPKMSTPWFNSENDQPSSGMNCLRDINIKPKFD